MLGADVAEWLELQTIQRQPSTWSSYQAVPGRYVLAHLGEVGLVDLVGRRLTRLYQHLLRSGGDQREERRHPPS